MWILDFLFVDIALRGASSGVLVVVAFLLALGPVPRGVKAAFTLTIFTHICRQWGAFPTGLVFDAQVSQVLRYLGTTTSVFFTWFLLAVFSDSRRFFWVWIMSAAVIGAGLIAVPVYRELVLPLRAFAALHYCGLVALILHDARDDLLQRRRIARAAVPVVIIVYAVVLALTSNPMVPGPNLMGPFVTNLLLFVTLATFAAWVFQVNARHWIGEVTEPKADAGRAAESRSVQDALCQRIEAAMQDGVWRQEGLTVGKLAQLVEAPEHQVRKAINQTLGFRNFSSFINQSRIEAAKALLRSRAHAATSVQQIAYDVGFGSLGPFNRAFRDTTGLSPSAYREAERP